MKQAGVKIVSALLAVATLAVLTSAAVTCGTLGSLPISGCVACEEIIYTADKGGRGRDGPGRGGKSDDDSPGRGGRGRGLLHGGRGGFGGGLRNMAGPRPSCTQCDAVNNFVLMTKRDGKPGICVCADGYGTVGLNIVNVTVDSTTLPLPQFTCAECDAGEVPLGPKSGLYPSYDNTTQTWSLKLKTWTQGDKTQWGDKKKTAGTPQRVAGKKVKGDNGKKGDGRGDRWDQAAVRPPWTPGQCVACPEGAATTDGITCVAA